MRNEFFLMKANRKHLKKSTPLLSMKFKNKDKYAQIRQLHIKKVPEEGISSLRIIFFTEEDRSAFLDNCSKELKRNLRMYVHPGMFTNDFEIFFVVPPYNSDTYESRKMNCMELISIINNLKQFSEDNKKQLMDLLSLDQ